MFRYIKKSLVLICLLLPVFPGAQTLKIWDFKYTDPKTRKAFDRVDHLFQDEYQGIQVEHTGFFDQEYIPALRTALLAGTGPDIIFLHGGTEFVEFSSYLAPLDLYLAESDLRFRQESLDAGTLEGAPQKALPLTIQGFGWYYNKELFLQAGLDPENPPMEWEDFLETCRILKDKGITPIAAGNNRPLTSEFIRRSLIGAFFRKNEIATFYKEARGVSSERFRTIITFCKTLSDSGYFHKEGLFRPYFNFAVETFENGKAAMIPGLLSDIAHWKNFSDALGADNVGYFPNLIHPDMANPGVQLLQDAGVLVCINRSSLYPDEAFLYLEHLFSGESQKILTDDLGLLSPLVDSRLPLEKYPVLQSIREAMVNTAPDPEMYVPSVFVSDMQYRLDDLLINTGEITVDQYLIKIIDELKLY